MNTYACVATESCFTEFYKHRFNSQNDGKCVRGDERAVKEVQGTKPLTHLVYQQMFVKEQRPLDQIPNQTQVPLTYSQTHLTRGVAGQQRDLFLGNGLAITLYPLW